MVSNLVAALIGAGGLIAGAAIGGVAQVEVLRRQHAHDRDERRNLAKAGVYRELLRHLFSIPAVIREATLLGPDQQDSRVAEWARQFDLLRADLGMFAPPEVREAAQDVREGLKQLTDAANAALKADEAEEGTEVPPESAFLRARQQFDEFVQPKIQRLADVMAHDADLR